ncbi:MAG: hypothetical protein HFJ54_07205 [Clostridia bacterium]|nr:hypothetical protein [Clostridia bacterium]
MSKFDGVDKKGNPTTMETDTHGPIRKTLGKLEELGYIKNYNETQIGRKRLIVEKLAFLNGDIKGKTDIYNITFERTDKKVNFEDETLRKAFPAVFSKRGIIVKKGYRIEADENGVLTIEYPKKKDRKKAEVAKTLKDNTIRKELRVEISEEAQRDFSRRFMDNQKEDKGKNKDFTK